MLNQKDFLNKVYEKSNQINPEDSFYNKNVYEKEKKEKSLSYKLVANFVFAFITLGAAGAIAFTTYQTISEKNNKPQYNWLDGSVKFNYKYEDFSKPIGEIVGVHNNTTLELVSQNYDGGIVVLEFDLKLSEEDKEYLQVGKNTFTNEEIEAYRKSFNGLADERINSYDPNLSEEKNNEIHEKWIREKEEYDNELEKMSLEKNAVKLFLNWKQGDRYSYKIDGEKVTLLNSQKQEIEKVGETEFKIYQMYFIPDEYVENKESFTLEFENIYLSQAVDRVILLEINEAKPSWYVEKMDFNEVENFELIGNFSVNFQNNNDVECINFENKIVSHNILTEHIEYVKKTPMQTIIKIKSEMNGIKSHTLATNVNEWYDSDLIGNINFNIYDNEDNVLNSLVVESKRDVWYSDGRYVKWEPYQIAPYYWDGDSPIGGRMEIITYVIVSNEDYQNYLKIVPTISKNIENYQITQMELEDDFEIIIDKNK